MVVVSAKTSALLWLALACLSQTNGSIGHGSFGWGGSTYNAGGITGRWCWLRGGGDLGDTSSRATKTTALPISSRGGRNRRISSAAEDSDDEFSYDDGHDDGFERSRARRRATRDQRRDVKQKGRRNDLLYDDDDSDDSYGISDRMASDDYADDIDFYDDAEGSERGYPVYDRYKTSRRNTGGRRAYTMETDSFDEDEGTDGYEDLDDLDSESFGVDSDEVSLEARSSKHGRRRGYASSRRGYGGSSEGHRGRGTRSKVPPPPPRMQRIKDKLVDAQADLKSRVSGVTHKGAKVIRELKGTVSSDLEKTLIKATRPDNDPAKRKHVNLLLQAAEHAFPGYMNPEDERLARWKEGPYWMTLHKLWRRMAEKDYRTAAKAVYVLHRLARGTTAESWRYFRMTLRQMRREADKGTKSRYFSRRVIRLVDDDGRPYERFLNAYAEFTLLRIEAFPPDLSELANIDKETSHADASDALEKAEELIECALACRLGPDLDNDVTCDCLKLVVEDLCELWALFQQKLEIRLQQRFGEGGFSIDELRRTLGFLEFYLDHLAPARDLVQQSHRMLALYSHAVPRSLGDALATDMLQEQVAWIQEELTEKAKASVGTPVVDDETPSARKASTARAGPSAGDKRKTRKSSSAGGRSVASRSTGSREQLKSSHGNAPKKDLTRTRSKASSSGEQSKQSPTPRSTSSSTSTRVTGSVSASTVSHRTSSTNAAPDGSPKSSSSPSPASAPNRRTTTGAGGHRTGTTKGSGETGKGKPSTAAPRKKRSASVASSDGSAKARQKRD